MMPRCIRSMQTDPLEEDSAECLLAPTFAPIVVYWQHATMHDSDIPICSWRQYEPPCGPYYTPFLPIQLPPEERAMSPRAATEFCVSSEDHVTAYMPELGHFWGSWGSEVWGPRPFQHLLTSSSPLLSDIRSYCQDCLLTLSGVGMPGGPVL